MARGDRNTFSADNQPASYVQKVDRTALGERSLLVLADLMDNAERDETRKSAAEAVNRICEGMPTQRIITAEVDDVTKLHDDALDAEIARLARERGAGAEGAPGTAAPGVSAGASDVVH